MDDGAPTSTRLRTTPGTARVELTAAQVRMVNTALVFFALSDHDDDHYNANVMDNALAKVQRAMERAGIEP